MSVTDRVPHPGEYIKDELEARNWTQRDLAFILGCPDQAITLIINGKRGISPDMAKALGNAFEVEPEFFLNLQRSYDLAHASTPSPEIAQRARLSSYPIRNMIKRGWLDDADTPALEAQMIRFFEVESVDKVPLLEHAAKKTDAGQYDDVPPEQLAWLFRVRQIAKTLSIPKYSEKSLLDVVEKLKGFLLSPEEIRNVPRLLMECGVRYVITEPLPSSKIDGVCFWLGDSPVIGMSLRYDRIDNFWFVLRHEIEHVLQKHGRQTPMIDADIQYTDSIILEEKIANAAAADFCVARDKIDSFFVRKAPYFYEKDILGFASVLQIHPGLVVGQIQHKIQRYDYLKKYLIKIRQFATQGAIVDGWGHVFPVTL